MPGTFIAFADEGEVLDAFPRVDSALRRGSGARLFLGDEAVCTREKYLVLRHGSTHGSIRTNVEVFVSSSRKDAANVKASLMLNVEKALSVLVVYLRPHVVCRVNLNPSTRRH